MSGKTSIFISVLVFKVFKMSGENYTSALQEDRIKVNHKSNEANQLRIEASPSQNDATRSQSVLDRINQFFVST